MGRVPRALPFLGLLAGWLASAGPVAAQSLADLVASARPAGHVVVIANDYVVVRAVALNLPAVAPREADRRPTVIYIRVDPGPGVVNSVLLERPPRARASRDPGAAPRAVHIEVLKAPPAPPVLGGAGTDLPRGAVKNAEWDGGSLVLATYAPQDFSAGAGDLPSVTTFLSDGVLDVTSRGVRRRMAVRAGDTFWFEAHTRLTVVGDDPVGAAIVQFHPDRRAANAD